MEVVSHRKRVGMALLILAVVVTSLTQIRSINVSDQHLFSANEKAMESVTLPFDPLVDGSCGLQWRRKLSFEEKKILVSCQLSL